MKSFGINSTSWKKWKLPIGEGIEVAGMDRHSHGAQCTNPRADDEEENRPMLGHTHVEEVTVVSVPPDPTKRRYLIADNSSWHKVKRLNWHHFTPKYLPPYSPDLNPIECLWLELKAGFFADFIAKTYEDLITQLIKDCVIS